MRKSRSDYAIVATICAAAHSTNITCARPLNVLKFLGLRLSCFEGSDGRTFSSLRSFSIERRPTRYDLHVSILQELFVVHLLLSLSRILQQLRLSCWLRTVKLKPAAYSRTKCSCNCTKTICRKGTSSREAAWTRLDPYAVLPVYLNPRSHKQFLLKLTPQLTENPWVYHNGATQQTWHSQFLAENQ